MKKLILCADLWVCKYGSGSYDALTIEKVFFTEYVIVYTSSYDHVLDLMEKGTMVSKNLIYIKKSDDEDFLFI